MQNIIPPTAYNRIYNDFAGADFSSDPVLVAKNRFPYIVNMYKDYKSSQGQAIETFPGFERMIKIPLEGTVVPKVHKLIPFKYNSGSATVEVILIHAGTKLYVWASYPNYPHSSETVLENKMLLTSADLIFSGLANAKSSSFIFNNACYILDGTTYRKAYYSGSALVCEAVVGYVPITFVNRIPAQSAAGELESTGAEVAQRNRISNYFINTFIAPTPATFPLELSIEDWTSVGVTSEESVITQAPTLTNKQVAQLDVAISTISAAGYAKLILSSYLFDSQEYEGYITVELSDTAATLGDKVREALKLSGLVTEHYTVGGVDEEVTLTAKKLAKIVTTYTLSENDIDSIEEVTVYGVEKEVTTNYTVDITKGIVTFVTAPTRPQDNGYAIDYAGISIKAAKAITSDADIINKCTLSAVFDNRAFFSGNPTHHNEVYHCMVDDPSYIGALCFFVDGKGPSPITALTTLTDTLLVLKSDTLQDASQYYHYAQDIESDLNPRIYPSKPGVPGIGCIGDCTSFLDDPVFVSRLGLKGIGQLLVSSERSIEHRSSLVDGRFVNEDLAKCLLEEWSGYLICLVNGHIYLADSRQVYLSKLNTKEYEWYYLQGIGVYEAQYPRYTFSSEMPEEFDDVTIDGAPLELAPDDIIGTNANDPLSDGTGEREILSGTVLIGEVTHTFNYVEYEVTISEVTYTKYYLVERQSDYIGGVFGAASCINSYQENIIFGTENGYICKFAFDKREDGMIPSAAYSFDNRAIVCGVATVFDNCGYPNLYKTTLKKSMVVKCKTLSQSNLKIRVRTNKSAFLTVGEINSSFFDFGDVDFADLTFNMDDQQTFVVNEKEKKWVEKQLYVMSDVILKPFALYHIMYQYSLVGRIK